MSSSVVPEIVVGHWFNTDTPMQPSNTTELPREGSAAGDVSTNVGRAVNILRTMAQQGVALLVVPLVSILSECPRKLIRERLHEIAQHRPRLPLDHDLDRHPGNEASTADPGNL